MTSPLAPVFADNTELTAFNQAVKLNADTALSPAATVQSQRYWASPVQPITSPIQDVLEVSFGTANLVNRLQLDISRFPQTMAIQYSETATGNDFVPVRDVGSKQPVEIIMLSSNPPIVSTIVPRPGHLHPQHDYAGHWEKLELHIEAVRMKRVRFVMQRNPAGQGPVDSFSNLVPYSLAIQNLLVGYIIDSADDVPRSFPEPGSITNGTAFATINDIFGSAVNFAARTNGAANLVYNDDDSAPWTWKCEPQPFPWAVVNFYADLRAENSNDAQTIDRIFIDPLNNGGHVTLYYSNDDPTGDFESSIQGLSLEEANLIGDPIQGKGFLSLGALGSATYINVLDSDRIEFVPGKPWWFGMEFQPNFDITVDPSNHPLFDCGEFQVGYNSSGIYLTTRYLDIVEAPLALDASSAIQLVVGYTGDSYHISVQQNQIVSTVDSPFSVPLTSFAVTKFNVGADFTAANFGNCTITALILKEELITSDAFLDNPAEFTTVPLFSYQETVAGTNTLLRLDFARVSPLYPIGLVGSRANHWDQKSWTPILRDYEMQRGYMQFSPTKAAFWKLEITNLQPTYNDVYVPVAREVLTFPPDVLQQFNLQAEADARSNPDDAVTLIQSTLSNAVGYGDFPLYVGTGTTDSGISNTQVYMSQDYNTAQRLAELGDQWRYQPLHAPRSAPRFSKTQVHNYTVQTISQTSKITYETGLRQIQFARVLPTAPQDSALYEEMFLDSVGISPGGNWSAPGSGVITSGSADSARVTSVALPSIRSYRGVQFAAQQADPKQILHDPNFEDETFTYWQSYGDGQVLGLVDTPFSGGHSVEVSRDTTSGYWASVESYSTWGNIVGLGLTYGNLRQGSAIPSFSGGIQSETFSLQAGGNIHAAARIVSTEALTEPVKLEIVDIVSGAVLASNSAQFDRDEIKEFTCSYDILQAIPQTLGNTWGTLRNKINWQIFTDTFVRANATSLGRMNSSQFWSTPSGLTSLTIASNQASSPSTGARSEIDTGTPWGTLSVTLGNMISTSAVPLIDLGGMLIMTDGTVKSTNISNTLFTLSHTLTAGHTYTFSFMPTSAVPGGQTTGADSTIFPYSVTITDNGSWFQTFSGVRAFSSLRALMGLATQTFTAFSWNPSTVQVNSNNLQLTVPQPDPSLIVAPHTGSSLYSWQEDINTTTYYDGYPSYVTNGTATEIASNPPGGYTIPATLVLTSVIDQFGSLEFSVKQLATGVTAGTTPIAYLSYNLTTGRKVTLMDDGTVFDTQTSSTVKSSMFGSATAGPITVRFLPTASLSSGFKTTWSISGGAKQAMIFIQGTTIVGVYSGTSIWDSTVRGVGGANDGTGTSGHYTLIEGFGWYPEASLLSLTNSATWGQVSYNDTRIYGDMEARSIPTTTSLAVRVVQDGFSHDRFFIDSVALFWDPIEWELSCDGGVTWWRAIDIRNKPNGVIMFPQGLTSYSNLQWRVTAFSDSMWISDLAIRPWYAGYYRDMPTRPTQLPVGPNVSPTDHYNSVDRDPRWQLWSNPVPRWWWLDPLKTDSST